MVSKVVNILSENDIVPMCLVLCLQKDQQKLATVDWNTWLYAEGMPNFQPQ